MAHHCLVTPHAAKRLAQAREFLCRYRGQASPREVVIVSENTDALLELVMTSLTRGPAGVSKQPSAVGWHRVTLTALAHRIATAELAKQARTAISPLGQQAIVTRVLADLPKAELGRFAPVISTPGFGTATAKTLDELRLQAISPDRISDHDPALAAIYTRYKAVLAELGYADRAEIFAAATRVATTEQAHNLVGKPLLMIDVDIRFVAQRDFFTALARRSPDAVLLSMTDSGLDELRDLPSPAGDQAHEPARHALERAQCTLFPGARTSCPPAHTETTATPPPPPTTPPTDTDDSFAVFSAPGEYRECVEIARRIVELAHTGVALESVAVLLRAPRTYSAPLAEALRRAALPAYFADGVNQPDPTGRAFLALLGCASQRLSATAFAEYLSLGVVPRRPREPAQDALAQLPPQHAALPPSSQRVAAEDQTTSTADSSSPTDPQHGPPRVPRRWEKLLVDAAVIGGIERWRRRIAGLKAQYQQEHHHPDTSPERRIQLDRTLHELDELQDFALPILERLDALPTTATWGQWLQALAALAHSALAQPERVLELLQELQTIAHVGPVGLRQVMQTVTPHLRDLRVPEAGSYGGKIYVAKIASARGREFAHVFIPGLAEKVFPAKVSEDPLLSDVVRTRLETLDTNTTRIERERTALVIALGAATRSATISYPRVEGAVGRPRVPSSYVLELVLAAEGRLPSFVDVDKRSRLGEDDSLWPAPADSDRAIDDCEYDLTMLRTLVKRNPDAVGSHTDANGHDGHRGAARYLLEANPYLARALRFRARRWSLSRFTEADGLVSRAPDVLAAMAHYSPQKRPYAATALEVFAHCPYKFYLRNIIGLAPSLHPEPIDELDARARGNLIHKALFLVLSQLTAQNRVPQHADDQGEALQILKAVLDTVSKETREALCPAIDRVFDDAIDEIEKDLRQWLAHLPDDDWQPAHAELRFGFQRRGHSDSDVLSDPASRDQCVQLDCGVTLRGSIDAVERQGNRLRVTDYKTGRAPERASLRTGGGKTLQPLLYAQAVEQLFPESSVVGGRLYFCTERGGYRREFVALDDAGKRDIDRVLRTIIEATDNGFLPAAPEQEGCTYCEFRTVCGPHEAIRVRMKNRRQRQPLEDIRRLP